MTNSLRGLAADEDQLRLRRAMNSLRGVTTLGDLTPQELQIALSLAEGRTTRETAAALFLSPKTIEYYLRNVYRKLDPVPPAWDRQPGGSAAVERLVQPDRGADQGQVGEGLGEVAQRLARAADLLGEQPQVVAVGQHLLEHPAGLVDAPGPG